MRNLLTPRWMMVKAVLFVALAVMAGAFLVLAEPDLDDGGVRRGRRLGMQPCLLLRVLRDRELRGPVVPVRGARTDQPVQGRQQLNARRLRHRRDQSQLRPCSEWACLSTVSFPS
jgi:hypothetical protein